MVPELFHRNVAESVYVGYMVTVLPKVTWCVDNFGHLTKLTLQCNFKCKTCLARYDHQYLKCGESPNTMTSCVRFCTHKQKVPFLVEPCIKFVWNVCFAAQVKFCCESV